MFYMLIPLNITPFYSPIKKNTLYQGDIIKADGIGLGDLKDETYPDYWMIITKSCDLTLSETLKTRKENISIIPLFALKILQKIYEKDLLNNISRLRMKLVFMAVWKISKVFNLGKLTESNIDKLIQNKITKYMYLPPDGEVFSAPMIIDFDHVNQLDGSNRKEVESVLNSKILQLASPFREKVAQRFADHYSSIGIDDEEIMDRNYLKAVKVHLKQP